MSGQNAALKEAQSGVAVEGVDPNHPARGVSKVIDAQLGTIELLMADGVTPRKKFALVGFAGSTRGMAPFDDPEWAICGLNQLNRHIPRADWWFEIHKDWNTALVPGTDHEGWLRDCGIPVMMTDHRPSLPTSVRYPIEEMVDEFADYFTSTVAYMIAYTIRHIDKLVERRLDDMPTEPDRTESDARRAAKKMYAEYCIGIFGVDLIVGEEYEHQRPCAEFYIGQALARGITVMIPPQSALCKARYRYGYQMEPDDLIKLRDLDARETELARLQKQHEENATAIAGARQELGYLRGLYQLRERGGEVGG